ncbi:MAG: metal ABC transporter permease [Candidatus Aminicenantes bacterium]|nr:metal ABC transporter permease [Candidatus Aminicenantes bacterium]
MPAFWEYAFLQRALAAGTLIAAACAVLGVFLVLRKDAMIGHGLSHIAFAGVALGLLVRGLPLVVALVFSVAAAWVLARLKSKAGLHGDTAIAVLSSGGLALGIVLASVARTYNAGLLAYLFGEILAISKGEVLLAVGLAGTVMAVVWALYPQLVFLTFDRESARASGLAVDRLDAVLSVLVAVTVVLGMRVVGLLLVSALVVIPAAAALQVAPSFRRALVLAAGLAVLAVVVGLALAYLLDLPASGSIVLVSLAFFGGTTVVRSRLT